MRISDWSSDVCSSDLLVDHALGAEVVEALEFQLHADLRAVVLEAVVGLHLQARLHALEHVVEVVLVDIDELAFLELGQRLLRLAGEIAEHAKSEEHTSELQSLMRISYAVFCLKKKKINQQTNNKIYT